MASERTLLVAISGCSSSGKTTLAKLITDILPSATLIHEDDFFKHDEDIPINEERQIRNWDSPEALDLELFRKELEHVKKTGQLNAQLIHNNNHDQSDAVKVSVETRDIVEKKFSEAFKESKVKLFLVDGFMMFHDEALASTFDLKLLIRAPYATLKKRRAARSGYQTLDSFWIDPPYYFDEFVYKSYVEAHSRFFEGGDVEGSLKKSSNIYDFMNDDGKDINEALLWVCDRIVALA